MYTSPETDWTSEDGIFTGLLESLGWAGTGMVIMIVAALILVAITMTSGKPGDIRISKDNLIYWASGIVGLVVLGLLLSWSIARSLPDCVVGDDGTCWQAL